MQKSKKQRIDRQLRQSLKTYRDLSPHIFSKSSNSLLERLYPDVSDLNSLRMFTVLEILYILEISICLLEKRVPNHVGDLKIGIIGGGITARLILNSILPLSKDGLNLKNITVSTRQVENFHVYSEQFGIKVVFKNEQTARDADILIIATPATLDNWVINDLRKPLQQRIQDHEHSNPKQPTNPGKITQQKSAFGKSSSVLSGDIASKMNGSGMQMSGSLASPSSTKRFMKPLVYILTSDFYEEKCDRLFQIPVLVPSIRAKNIKSIHQYPDSSQVQYQNNQDPIERAYARWLVNPKTQQRKIDSREGKSELESYGESELESKLNKYYATPFLNIFKVLNYCFGNLLSVNSLGSSLSITVSINESSQGKKNDETMSQIYDIATIFGEVEDTFLKKCRKWKMAHNNFIA